MTSVLRTIAAIPCTAADAWPVAAPTTRTAPTSTDTVRTTSMPPDSIRTPTLAAGTSTATPSPVTRSSPA